MTRLWYNRESSDWNEALPLGNGRLGAMIYGTIYTERIQLNEESIWSGGKRDRINETAHRNIEKLRRLLHAGEITQAQELSRLAFNGTPVNQRVYQTAGQLELDFDNHEDEIIDYRRELDIERAVASVSYTCGARKYTRTMLISAPDDIAVMHLHCSEQGGISLTARLTRGIFLDNQLSLSDTAIAIEREEEIAFTTAVKASVIGGSCATYGGIMRIENADEVVLFIDCRTSYRCGENYRQVCSAKLEEASRLTFYDIHHRHVADYAALYSRFSLTLGDEEQFEQVPTNVRIDAVRRGSEDGGLVTLYCQFARYLMISGSRKGTLPLTLQGLWNEFIDPPWGCKYTININTEMNYWPACMSGLEECELPLFDHLKVMYPNGRETARKMYGCNGFVAHHNTDIWGDCAPQDDWIPATIWPLGAAWLCTHIWEHYDYTRDTRFLADNYVILRESCRFFCEYLIENDRGELIISPSVSPENTYRNQKGEKGSLCEGCAMDSQILRQLFEGCLKAEKVLNVPQGEALGERLEQVLERLPAVRIAPNGTIMEWNENYEEVEIGHRHVSHLYALYPSSEINVEHTPELAAAARATLERRLRHGGGHTGWSRAWIINFWARLRDADLAYDSVVRLLCDSTLPNLLDNHPPFQIDGNFGALAGIIQMIIQSIGNDVILLPALPAQWASGEIHGVCLRGAISADMQWENGAVTSLVFTCREGGRICLVYGGKRRNVDLVPGENRII